ncbi:glycerol-3-phosphate dehydrogenase [Cladochytrium replicatum]|nr:glycerol-3-phosphate dehydrogenase [Cladochytrium replicatum]
MDSILNTDIEDMPCGTSSRPEQCTSCKKSCSSRSTTLASSQTQQPPNIPSLPASSLIFGRDPASAPPEIYDVLIIGAGAVGCSIARELSRYNLSTIVVDKSNDVAQGASKANSGIIHGGYDETHGTLKSRLAKPGNRMFTQLDRELKFGLKRCGSLVLAHSAEEVQVLEHLLGNGRLNGVERLEMIRDQAKIRNLEPNVHPDVVAALWCPDAGVVSPYIYTISLAENAIMNGVEFRMEHEVLDIQRTDECFEVRCSHETVDIRSKIIINCAGLFADKIAAMVGADDFKIMPRKGEYILLDRDEGARVKRVLFPVPSKVRGKGILVSPTFNGNLLLGPTSRSRQDAFMTNKQVMEFIISSARHSVPDFDVTAAITSYAGLRAKSDRGDFIVEPAQDVQGFINVAGIDSPGLTSSPAIAKMVVGEILPSLKMLDMQRNLKFDPSSRSAHAPLADRPADDHLKIDHQLPTHNIICRCETVLESQIVDSIHRPLPATTTDMVKKRTRAGMGQCQGSFCEERVARLIARELKVPVELVPRRGRGTSLLPHRRVTVEDAKMLAAMGNRTEQSVPKPKL